MDNEKDLKQEEEKTLPEIDRSEKKLESEGEDTPKTETDFAAEKAILEDKLNKILEERDNYKQGMLNAKEELKKFKKEPDSDVKHQEEELEKKEELQKPKEQKETLPSKSSYNPEKEAIAQFERKHPDVKFEEVRGFYRGERGKETVADILDDLEDALDYRNFKKGGASSFQGFTQDAGSSERPTSVQQKVTKKDIDLADRYFDGDLNRYLKYRDENK